MTSARIRVLLLPSLVYLLLLLLLFPRHVSSTAAGTDTLVGIVGSDFILLGADSSVRQSIALTASNLDKIAVVTDAHHGTNMLWQQQAVAVAAAGNPADTDRLVGMLSAQAALHEYSASWGGDVVTINCGEDDDDNTMPPLTAAGLSVQDVANLARAHISHNLRSSRPLQVCLLVAGMMPVTSSPVMTMRLVPSTATTKTYVSEQVQKQIQTTVSQTKVGESPPRADVPTADFDTALQQPHLEPRLYWLDEYGSLQSLQYGSHGYGSNFILSILDQGYKKGMNREEAVKLLRGCFEQLRMRYIINSPQPPCIKCIDATGCRIITP